MLDMPTPKIVYRVVLIGTVVGAIIMVVGIVLWSINAVSLTTSLHIQSPGLILLLLGLIVLLCMNYRQRR